MGTSHAARAAIPPAAAVNRQASCMSEDTSHQDRMRVHRVRIGAANEPREIESCWISIYPAQQLVKIWLAREESAPALVVPLLDVVIEWEGSEAGA
jgi:hypothetical protein